MEQLITQMAEREHHQGENMEQLVVQLAKLLENMSQAFNTAQVENTRHENNVAAAAVQKFKEGKNKKKKKKKRSSKKQRSKPPNEIRAHVQSRKDARRRSTTLKPNRDHGTGSGRLRRTEGPTPIPVAVEERQRRSVIRWRSGRHAINAASFMRQLSPSRRVARQMARAGADELAQRAEIRAKRQKLDLQTRTRIEDHGNYDLF